MKSMDLDWTETNGRDFLGGGGEASAHMRANDGVESTQSADREPPADQP
jgi:hypothetical protein